MADDFDAYDRLKKTMPDDLDVQVDIHVRLHRNGSLSVLGPIGDPAFCERMLQEGIYAIQRQPRMKGIAAPGDSDIVVPGGDVDSRPKEVYVP